MNNYVYIKNVAKHRLLLDRDTLNFVLKKTYSRESEEMIRALAKIARSVNIPHIYTIDTNSQSVITLEQYISGTTLRELYSQGIELREKQYYQYISSLLDILTQLEAYNIIHKDIKPENIIICDEAVYLIDFDISREYKSDKTQDTKWIGTSGYASPEQYGFAQTTVKSDIYSLGVTMKELTKFSYLRHQKARKLHHLIDRMTEVRAADRPDLRKVRRKLDLIFYEHSNTGLTRLLAPLTFVLNLDKKITSKSIHDFISPFLYIKYNVPINYLLAYSIANIILFLAMFNIGIDEYTGDDIVAFGLITYFTYMLFQNAVLHGVIRQFDEYALSKLNGFSRWILLITSRIIEFFIFYLLMPVIIIFFLLEIF